MNKKLIFCFIFLIGCEQKAVIRPLHKVHVSEAKCQDMPLYQTYTGQLVANVSVELKAQASGVLIEQHFVEGDDVKEGQLLLVVEPLPYEAALSKAKAQLSETYASLKYSQEKTKRYASLVKQDFVSQLDYDQYLTDVLLDEAQMKQNLADIETAKINLDYCYLTAPMDCVTGKLQVKPGNYVDAAANTVLTVLNQIEPILVNFYVPETDLMQIQLKNQQKPLLIDVFLHSDLNTPFHGTLSLIDNQVNPATGAILMQGTLENKERFLWPGSFTDVHLILEEHVQTIVVPTQAVLIGLKNPYVYVVKADGTIAMQDVVIGQRFQEITVIQSGVEQGDQVVVEGQLNVYPGLKVEVIP